MLEELAFQIAKRRIRSFDAAPADGGELHVSTEAYGEWRQETLEREFLNFFDPAIVQGKDVLDFGCGEGALSFLMVRFGAKSCIGVDLDQTGIDSANRKVRGEPITFVCGSDSKRIELGDESVDVIVCFDVMEHIMDYEPIMREWRRVLRPGGKILIHWQPWFHPHGHHGQRYIPIPWIHVFLNSRQRAEVCARIVELPEFDAPFYDRDDKGSRINRFREQLATGEADDETFLNKLTTWRFERLCRRIGLKIERRTYTSFEGPPVVSKTSWLLSRIPLAREFFTANAVYILAAT